MWTWGLRTDRVYITLSQPCTAVLTFFNNNNNNNRLIHLGSFPECWRSVNVTAIPKGAPSPDRESYWQISITPILCKVNEKLVSHKLCSFCEKCVLLPAAQFAYRKGLGCTDALLTISHHLQKYLDAGWSLISFISTLVQPSID